MRLIGVDGPAKGRAVEIGPEGLQIGKRPDCDLVLDDAYTSRSHAAIVPGRAATFSPRACYGDM